jgi:hypothetical protein
MSQISPQTPHDPAAESEHLLNLHKMSTTAGLGSGDYVAVNVTAVVTVLCGLASILVMLGDLLMVIPAVGILTGWLALVQVSRSNGTQTGRGLAWVGLLLCALIGGGKLMVEEVQSLHRKSDTQQIIVLFRRFGELVRKNQLDDAYDLFDSAFHSRVDIATFKGQLSRYQNSPGISAISAIDWDGVPPEYQVDSNGDESAQTMLKLILGTYDGPRMDARLRRSGDVWLIDNVPDMFPAKDAAQSP